MNPANASSPTSPSPSPNAAVERFTAVRMPIEGPVEDIEEAVEKLRQCSSTELRRARKHHRRALESLRNGGYSALSDATRHRLADRLRNNLEALNRALDASPPTDEGRTSAHGDPDSPGPPSLSLSSQFRSFFQGLW